MTTAWLPTSPVDVVVTTRTTKSSNYLAVVELVLCRVGRLTKLWTRIAQDSTGPQRIRVQYVTTRLHRTIARSAALCSHHISRVAKTIWCHLPGQTKSWSNARFINPTPSPSSSVGINTIIANFWWLRITPNKRPSTGVKRIPQPQGFES